MDTKGYESLLLAIKNKKGLNDEDKLQRELLYKLINISSKKLNSYDILKPTNQKAFEDIFILYTKYLLEAQNLKFYINNTASKIALIKTELRNENFDLKEEKRTLNLQYAFYKKMEESYSKQLSILQEALKKMEVYISNYIFDNRFVIDIKKLKQHKTALKELDLKIDKFTLEKDRLELFAKNSSQYNNIVTVISNIKESIEKERLEILTYNFLLYSKLLKEKKREVFNTEQDLITQFEQINLNKETVNSFKKFLRFLEKEHLGYVKTLIGRGQENLKNLTFMSWEYMNFPLFFINESKITILKFIISLGVFIFGFMIAGLYKLKIKKNFTSLNMPTRIIVANIGYYILLLIFMLIVLNILGINLSSFALIVGALSVGIGFGLQNIISNFVSGIILIFEKSLKIGDYIEIDNNLAGNITDIRMRSTTIKTTSNIDVIVPNLNIIQSNVINWTMEDKIRSFLVPFGVAYGTESKKVIEIVLEAVKKANFGNLYEDKDRFTKVYMTKMDNSSVNFELLVWIEGEDIFFTRKIQSQFLLLIYETLNEHGITIPFPQLDLHIKKDK
jgi:small-conductance mechanosensitive channel